MSLIQRVLNKSVRQDSQLARAQLAEQVREYGTGTPLYVLGANTDSERWIAHLNVQAVVDDFKTLPAQFGGRDIIRMCDIPDGALVINCVTNSRPSTAMRRLKELTGADLYFGADLKAVLGDALLEYKFVADSQRSLQENADEWQRLYEALFDAESRSTLEDVLAYRLTGDPRILGTYSYRPTEQYFEGFLGLRAEVFVDGGAFDGETTQLFASKYPDYLAAHVFEPDELNFQGVRDRLKEQDRLVFHEVGLSSEKAQLSFQLGEGSASVITASGEHTINVDTIDTLVPAATFIKLDLEGWELNALKGAQQTIIQNKPKLAVGAYHSPDDFLKIFDWVTKSRDDYRVALRHYTESWTESVLYFY